MATFKNKIAASCKTCGEKVPVGQGWTEGPPWVTTCATCSGTRTDSPPKVLVTLEPRRGVVFKLSDFLGGDLFSKYRAAIEGTKFDGIDRANYTTVDKAIKILPALAAAGFILDVKPEVMATIQEKAAQFQGELSNAHVRAQKVDEELKARGLALFPFQKHGVSWLASRDSAFLADDMGLGKAQPVSEKVLTPGGWVPIGSLKVGDKVIGSNGYPTKVTGVFPQGQKEVFRIRLTDGASTRCCKEHLWCVQTPNDRVRGDKTRVHSLEAIVSQGLRDSAGNRKWFIPVAKATQFEERDFPAHPYLLGALVANGTLGTSTLHSGPDEQRAEMLPYLPAGLAYQHSEGVTYRIGSARAGLENHLTRALTELELQFTESHTKFIPDSYLFGSVRQRQDLLEGLLDNDGTISKDGTTIEYNTVSEQLAQDILNLVRSLGGVAWVSTREPKFTYKGETRIGRTDYRICLAVPFCPFRMSWKKARYTPRSKYSPAHAIDSVTSEGLEECVCISVEAADHLYVTADFILTHNTIQLLIALPENAPVIVLGPKVAKSVWKRETGKWRPDFRVTILDGKGSFRYPEAGEMVVLTYDVMSLPEGVKPLPGTVVIADEVHLVKSSSSRRGREFRALCDMLRTSNGKVWLASATPLMNRPPELWSLFNAANLAQEAFGTWSNFTHLFDGVQDKWGGWSWGTPKSEVAERIRRVSLRRLKTDVLDQLPPKTYREIQVDLDAKAKKALAKAEEVFSTYDRFARINDDLKPSEVMEQHRQEEEKALVEFLGDSAGDIEVATKLIRKVGRAGFEELSKARKALAMAKIPAMLEVVEEFEAQEEPLVVFSDHRAPIDFFKGREGWAVITGDTSADERGRIQDDFQAGKLKGVAATIKAGGVAITLTRASHALFVDLNWTPALNSQAEDRIFRIGQSRGVVITTLVANHLVDARLFELLASKRQIVQMSVDASRVMNDVMMVKAPSFDPTEILRAIQEERRKDEEAKKAAEERRKEFEGKQEEIAQKNAEEERKRKEQERRDRRERRWLREAEVESSPRHVAQSERERWVTEKLQVLAALDPDRAAVKNDVGFSASDGSVGHKYAYLSAHVGLTEYQWAQAYTLCRKYHRQVGSFEG